MSIYPTRNRQGALTGSYRVEVQKGKRRLRRSASSMRDAKLTELELQRILDMDPEAGMPLVREPSEAQVTLGSAIKRARGVLWEGQADELKSLRKLNKVADLMGHDLPLDAFDTSAVDTFFKLLTGERPLSKATLNRYRSCISKFMQFCVDRDLRRTPAPKLAWHKESAGRLRWLSYEDEATMMDLLPEPFRSIVYVAIRTGMRAGEILSLTQDQVTLGWCHLWTTKNGEARSVPLNPDLHKRLVKLLADGMPTYDELQDAWDKGRKAMGLMDDKGFVFHSTRHTFAVRAIQANVNLRVLQKLMGHKTIQTTLRYASVEDQTLADAALAALAFHDKRGTNCGGRGTKPSVDLGKSPFVEHGNILELS